MTHPTPLPAVDADVAALTFLAEHIEHANSELVAISSGAAPCIRRILTALTAAQARAEAVEWISVDERLPEDDQEYLVYAPRSVYQTSTAHWLPDVKAWRHEWLRKKRSEPRPKTWITHWRPKPAPPAADTAIGGKGA